MFGKIFHGRFARTTTDTEEYGQGEQTWTLGKVQVLAASFTACGISESQFSGPQFLPM